MEKVQSDPTPIFPSENWPEASPVQTQLIPTGWNNFAARQGILRYEILCTKYYIQILPHDIRTNSYSEIWHMTMSSFVFRLRVRLVCVTISYIARRRGRGVYVHRCRRKLM